MRGIDPCSGNDSPINASYNILAFIVTREEEMNQRERENETVRSVSFLNIPLAMVNHL